MTDVVVRDLVVEYPSADYVVRPIDGLNLDVPSGSLTILLGPSGCGKTTLLSCLAGILSPTSGSVRVGGVEVTALGGASLTAYRRSTVGVVFQAFNLVPSLTAEENVVVPLLAAGARKRVARARARSLLDQVDLSQRLTHRPGDLSGGQQQRVAIARALVHDPPLIIADEPTAHLDYVQVEGILRLVRSLATAGRAVIVATHDERMVPLADQVVELTPRAAAASGPTHLELEDGEVLFAEGDRSDRVYVVDRGRIEVLRVRPDQTEDVLVIRSAGEYFGEMGPIFNLPRSAAARAKGPATVTGYTLGDFRELVGARQLTDLLDGTSSVVPVTGAGRVRAAKPAANRAAPKRTAAKRAALPRKAIAKKKSTGVKKPAAPRTGGKRS